MAKKTLIVFPVDDDMKEWITRSQKEMKIKNTTEFMRTLLNHIRATSEIKELKDKMELAHIEERMRAVTAEAEKAAREKAVLEKQREKLISVNA